jgi:LYR motif-containing protein 4
MNQSAKIKLYKDILKAAKAFPSVKRNKIIEEIKVTFRANRNLDKEEDILKAISVATKGLSQLSMYSGLKGNRSGVWSVQLEQTPMPKPSDDTV